ncbi:MAG TPA: cytochrome b6-f complex subunit PetL [Nodosilinea sp.]|nr:cytochrome b6-f complex subunit PetL [Nodosilinea sp.]
MGGVIAYVVFLSVMVGTALGLYLGLRATKMI